MTLTVLKEYIQAEIEKIRETLNRVRAVRSSGSESPPDVEVAALSVYIHNIYNGVENILKLIRTHRGEKTQKTPHWHRELLNSSRDQGIIDPVLWTDLDKLLSFRHHLVHSYVFKVEWPAIRSLVGTSETVVDEFERQVIGYLDRLPKE